MSRLSPFFVSLPSVLTVASLAGTAALMGCNAAPIAPVVAIDPGDPTTVDDFELVFLSRAQDPDLADTVTYDIRWYLDGAEVEDLVGKLGVTADRTAKGQEWVAHVVPIDSEGEAGQGAEAVVTVQNTPPLAQVEITPSEPGSYEDLTAVATGEDIDWDSITYTYAWLRNGELVEDQTGSVVTADATVKGELWTVQVTPNDGEDDGEIAEFTVSVGNALPIATEVFIDPVVVREDTVLTARPTGFDEDEDPLTWTFTWYVNDEALPGVSGDTLDGSDFDKGDRIVVEATPNDGFVDGESVRSAPVRVRNSAPTLEGATIDPSEAYEASTLSCLGSGFADLDGDEVGYKTTWFVNGARMVSENLDGTRFDKGDVVSCELAPFDGTEEGDAVATDPITILNTKPVITRVSITNTTPKEGDTLEVRIEGTGDDDGDTVTFEYSWLVDGTPVASTSTLSSDLFDKDQIVSVTVTPWDGEEYGTALNSAPVTVQNTAPVMDTLVLTPTELRTNDTLTATAAATDADGDTITFDYAWYVDGALVGATGRILDGSSWFDKNEDVYVVVTPNDGDEDGAPMTSAEVTVLNTAPSISGVTISPSTIKEELEITCVPSGWSDDDGDSETYDFVWYVNSKKVGISAKLDGDFFDRGDEVWCEVTPTDGDDDGETVASSKLTVANTAPTISKVELSSTSPVEGDTVYAVIIGADDVDGDSIDYAYAWYVDGSMVSTADEIDSSLFAKGDDIYVIVTPSDDVDTGVGVKSDTGTVANTAPVVTGVTFSPTAPKTDEAVTATVSSTDVDGDSVSYSYEWYVDKVKVSSTSATLATSDFKKNQDIYVVVTPTDGDDAGKAFTSRVITSVNTVPSITGVTITPSVGITESSTLTCVPAGWSDADGDTEAYAYQWRVDGKLVAITKTLTGSSFAKGDSITCTATPNDGEDLGTPITSAAVSVANTPPTLAGVTLSTTTPQEGDTISATLGAASDADGDRISFKYAWKVNGSTVSTATTLTSADFDKGDTVELVVTPTDGVDDGTPVSSGTVTVQNTAPVISTVTLSPTSPQTADTVSAAVSATDADGDSLTYTYAWKVNGTTVSATTATLASSFFKKGDTIQVTVTPSDGDDSGSAVSSSVITAVNTPASISSVTLSPSSFGESDTVTCVPAGWSDPDGDAAGYVYQWKINGTAISRTTASITGADFDKGDTVQCIVTPNDGDDLGTPVGSAVVRAGNSAPSLTSATITPSSPKEKDVLRVTLGSYSDPDGDTVTFKYAWYVGSTLVATTPTLTGVSFDKGDVIEVEVTPTDGVDDGTAVTSATVTVDNTAPVVSSVVLTPSKAGTDTTLSATVTASDVDGDSLTYSYAWYVDGSKVSATGSTLDGTVWFDKGETVYVEVSADDGDDSSTVVSSAVVTIGNSPPSITSATISPTTVYEATTLTCTPAGWSDPDGDSAGYTYRWTVNGAPSATTTTLTGASFKKGDTIGCRVTPFDGTDSGTPVSAATVKVLNTAPVLSSVSLSTLTPSETDTITVTLGSASDADGDSISYTYAWYVNGKLVASSTTLDGTYFGSGDTIYVEVTPDDGTDDGTAVRSATATVSNTAPVISSVTLAPSSPKTNDILKATVVASDADGDSLSYSYEWKVDGVTQAETSSSLSGVSYFDKGESITVTATVTDGKTPVSRTSAAVVVANTAPKITAATLSATSVKEGDSITCSPVGWSDADGDSAGYKYQWFDGSTPISGATAATITWADFGKGDSLRCRIIPWDGDDDGAAVFSPTATVLNTKPVATAVTLSNLAPRTTQSVTASVTGVSDADGDSVSLRYQWYVGGALRRTTTTTSTSNTLSASEFVKNQDIYVVVTPYDGAEYGSSISSSTGRSVNTQPTISSVSLSPSTVRTGNSITASSSASDADGDGLTYTYAWYHQNEGSGGWSKIGGSGNTLSSSLFDKADRIYVTLVVNDGETNSATFTSSTITIANTAPTTPGISLSPGSPTDKQNITCSGSGGTDVDGDSLSYRYWWYRNGSYYTTTSSTGSSTISASVTSAGQTWRCEVARFDGTDYSSRSSRSVTVVPSGPVCSTIYDFNSWSSGWASHGGGGGGTRTSAAAHDGTYGVRDMGWHRYTSVTTGYSGEKIRLWSRLNGSGRVYFGFDGNSGGAKSFVLATNTQDIHFQTNNSWGYSYQANVNRSISSGKWYLLEVEFSGTTAIGRLYDSNGTTLLNTTSYNYGESLVGNVVVRGFGSADIDTLVQCK